MGLAAVFLDPLIRGAVLPVFADSDAVAQAGGALPWDWG